MLFQNDVICKEIVIVFKTKFKKKHGNELGRSKGFKGTILPDAVSKHPSQLSCAHP